jgi:uncharacterized membrane protein YcaP (DUF421 family)
MWTLAVPWWELVVRSIVVYLALLAVLRVFGKREVGQFTLFDLVVILLVANAVQPAMTGADYSLLGGLIIIATLMGVDRTIALARARIPFIRRLLESTPTVIARDGEWLQKALDHEDVTIDDAEMALREHGIESVKDVSLAVLEADGSISVVPIDHGDGADTHRPRRRLRIVRRL